MAGNNLGILSAKVALDTVDFNRNIQAMKRELKLAQSETRLASQGIIGYGQATTTGAAQLQGLSKQISLQRQALTEYDARYKEAIRTQGEGSAAAQNAALRYNQTAAEISRLEGEYGNLSRQIALNNDGYYRAGTSLQQFSAQGMKAADTAMDFGEKWTVAGAALAGVITVGAKAAMDYESSFASVTKTVDGTTQELNQLSDGIREMALDVPVAASDLAELAAVAGQLGIRTENVESFTRTIADLGVSTNLAGEEGAFMLAKFTNITKMDQTSFSNLGSSVVELGNNFATTESDIMGMATRLAGAGAQVGMSEADIIGLSAALSSVGIEAEAGGSAISKVMVKMQLATSKGQDAFASLQQVAERNGIAWDDVSRAVANGGKELKNMSNAMGLGNKGLADIYKSADDAQSSLNDFAYVAGMSGDEFARAFQEDAVGAIGKFIEGLGNANEKGTTAIEMLDNMGISEVRLRDSLLRAGGASELFANAVQTSNKAWGENTALTKEAETRYETTAGKVQLAKNKISDLAIEFGSQLLPVLADALESSAPLIDSLKKMVQGFSDASPATKKFVLAIAGIAIAGGPVLMALSSVTKGVLSVTNGIGGALVTFGRYRTGTLAASAATTALSGTLGTAGTSAAAGATQLGAVGAQASLLPALISPVGLALAGTMVVLGAGALAWTMWGKEAYESSVRVQKWGSDVGKEADQTLTKFQTLSSESQLAMDGFAAGVEGSDEKVKKSTEEMLSEIERSAKKSKEALDKVVEQLPESAQKAATKNAESLKKNIDEMEKLAEESGAQINRIYDKHAKEGTKLTKDENELVLANRKLMINQELEILKISGKDKKSVLAAVNADVNEMTQGQADKQFKAIQESVEKEKESYKKQLKNLKEARDSGLLTEKQYNSEKNKLESSHNQLSETLMARYIEVARKSSQHEIGIRKNLSRDFDLHTQDVKKKLEEKSKAVKKSDSAIIESTTDMSQKTIEANQRWNALIFDEKKGKVKTNLREVIKEAGQSEEGWNDLKFILKNAKLSSNSKTEMAMALIGNGQWNNLSYKEKNMLVKSNLKGVIPEILDAKGEWSKIEDSRVKEMLIYSNSKEELAEILADADLWDKLDWSEKKLLLDSDVKEKTLEFLESSGKWQQLNFEEKRAIIKADGEKELSEVMLRAGLWNQLPIENKKLLVKNEASLSVIQAIQDVGVWDQLSPKVQTALVQAKGEDELFELIERYGVWEKLPEPTKQLLIDNAGAGTNIKETNELLSEFTNSVLEPKKLEIEDTEANRVLNGFGLSIQSINNDYNIEEKKAAVEAEEANQAINNLTGNLSTFNQTELAPKTPVVNSEDADNKVTESTNKLNVLDATNPIEKFLKSNNDGIIGPTQQAMGSLSQYDNTNPAQKSLKGENGSVKSAANESVGLINNFNSTTPGKKHFTGSTNAAAVGSEISGMNSNWDTTLRKQHTKEFTVTTFFKTNGKAPGFEKGTNYHKGGPAIVNDQKGPTFKELIIEPSGHSYIPEGRDVLINLPKGSKVIPAGITKNMVPHYAKGAGLSDSMFRSMADMLIPFRVDKKIEVKSATSESKELRQLIGKVERLIEKVATPQKIQSNKGSTGGLFEGAVFNWYGKEDIRKTFQEFAHITESERRRLE